MTSYDDVLAEEYIPTDRPMRIGRYLLGAVIGEGKSCTVRRAVRDGDKKRVAVKVLNKLAGHLGALIQLQYQQEVEALRRIRHKNVIGFHDNLQSQKRFYIVVDLLRGDLLSSYVELRCGLQEDEARTLTSQLTSAIAYLHKSHVVHRDLKPDNIILNTTTLQVTIIDFGLSATTTGTPHLTRHCGTPAYMAPEVTGNMGYSCPVDMWSLGVTLVEMLQGSAPRLHDHYNKGTYPKLVQRRDMFNNLPSVSKECVNFLDRLLQIYPEKRMNANDACLHVWLRALKKSNSDMDSSSRALKPQSEAESSKTSSQLSESTFLPALYPRSRNSTPTASSAPSKSQSQDVEHSTQKLPTFKLKKLR